MAVYGPRGHGDAYEHYKPQHIQDIQRRQDKINEIVMVLEANVDVMKSLCKFYTDLKTNRHFPQALKDACGEDILAFTAQVEDMMYDLKMQIARATVLVKITNDRKEIVSLSNLLGANPLTSIDITTSSKSGYRKNGTPKFKHGEGSDCGPYHHHCHPDLPPCYLRLSEFRKILSRSLITNNQVRHSSAPTLSNTRTQMVVRRAMATSLKSHCIDGFK
jgi:hypothetical protein